MKQKRKQNNKSNQITSQSQHYESEINIRKLNTLSSLYESLPSNGFSKLVVTLCLFCAIIAIIVSFVMLCFGIDASGLLSCSLLFFGGELFVLGFKNFLNREQTKEEILFNEIKKDLNDGFIYDENGRVISNVTYNTTNNTYNDTTYNASHEDESFSVETECVENTYINNENNEFGSADEDGRD